MPCCDFFPHVTYTVNTIVQEKSVFEYLCMALSAFAPVAAILFSIKSSRSTDKKMRENELLADKKMRKSELLKENNNLLELAMLFPYLESDTFCNNWDGDLNNEKKLRYHLYACKVYNFLLMLYDFHSENGEKMSDLIDVDDYIKTHRKWLSFEADKTPENEKFNQFLHHRIQFLSQGD